MFAIFKPKPVPAHTRKHKTHSLPSQTLGSAKLGLRVLSSVGDGIPGLKGAAQIAIQIIEASQMVQSNKADCGLIADRTSQRMSALIESLEGRTDDDIDSRLRRNLDNLKSELENILDALKELDTSNTISHIMRNPEESRGVIYCKELLDQAFKTFQIDTTVGIHLSTNEMKKGITEIKQNLRKHIAFSPSDGLLQFSAPPPAPQIFFGRGDFVAEAVSLLVNLVPTRICILGAGGMGKTATALTILHHHEVQYAFQRCCYFVPCDAATSPRLLITSILQVFHVKSTDREDSLTTLHRFLESLPKILIMLDNFETSWESPGAQVEVEDILCRISALKHVSLLVTMRGSVSPLEIQWAQLKEPSILPPLTHDAAKSLFLAVNPTIHYLDSDLDLLLQELDYIPLAIKLIAQVGKGHSCKHLLKRWRTERTALLQTQESPSGRLTSIEVSISISLESLSKTEDPEAIQLLAIICNLPDGLMKWEERLTAIAVRFKHPEHLVDVLLRTALVFIESDALRTLSPIRHYMLVNKIAEIHHIKELEQYYIDMISEYASMSYGPALLHAREILEPEVGNITSLIKYAMADHPYEDIVHAVYSMSQFLYKTCPSKDLLVTVAPHLESLNMTDVQPKHNRLMGDILYSQAQYEEARKKLIEAQGQYMERGNKLGAVHCVQSLGDILRMQNRYKEARQRLVEAEKQFTEIGEQLGAAQCLRSLGDMLRMQSRYDVARDTLKRAKQQFLNIGNQRGAVQCLRSLGDILSEQSRFVEATRIVLEAQHQFETIGEDLGTALCLLRLGTIFRMQSKYDDAKEIILEAQEQFMQIGNQRGAAKCLRSLGDVLHMQSRYDEAEEKLLEAQQVFIKIGNPRGGAQCLRILGDMQCTLSKFAESREKVLEAKNQFAQIGEPLGEARCMQGLGKILYLQRRLDEAKDVFTEAEEKFIEIGNQCGAAQCLRSIAVVLRHQTKFGEAWEKLEEAQRLFNKIGDLFGVAQCLQSLSTVLSGQHRYEEAMEKLLDAEEQFVEIDGHWGEAQCIRRHGDILHMQGHHEEAKEKILEAHAQFRRIEDVIGEARCLQSLSTILCVQGRYEEAKEALVDAQQHSYKIGDLKGVAQCLQSLADVLHLQCHYDEAREKLVEAWQLFEQIGCLVSAKDCDDKLEKILDTAMEEFRKNWWGHKSALSRSHSKAQMVLISPSS